MFARMLSRVSRWVHQTDNVVQLNDSYVVKVSELMRTSLPKPHRKSNVIVDADGTITPIIRLGCDDDFRYTK